MILIPQPYTVKKGDTVYGIARQFSVPVGKLQDLNRLGQNARIKTGDRLYIPTQQAAAAVAAAIDVTAARPAAASGAGAAAASGTGGQQRRPARLYLPGSSPDSGRAWRGRFPVITSR